MVYEVAISKIPLRKTFLYSFEDSLEFGERVLVDFNNRNAVAYVVGLVDSKFAVKVIKERIDGSSFLSVHDVEMIKWSSEQFYSPMGQLFDLMIPSFVDEYAEVFVEPISDLLGLQPLKLKDFLSIYGEKTLGTYLKKGYVRLRKVAAMKTPRPRVKELFVTLNLPLNKALHIARLPYEYDVINYLFSKEGSKVDQVIEATGISIEQLRKMERKGLITFTSTPTLGDLGMEGNDSSLAPDLGNEEWLVVKGSVERRFKVILNALKSTIEKGKSVLYLVPLWSQAPYLTGMIQRYLGVGVCIYHGGISKSQKALTWFSALKGEPKVFVGTRLGVFLPIRNLGLVIIESDEDESYYQFDEPVYDAVRMARRKALSMGIPIIFSSATGRIDDYFNVDRSRIFTIPDDPKNISIVDMRKQTSFVSEKLLERIKHNLESDRGVVVAVRRKGYAPFITCAICGYTKICPRCDVAMSFHKSANLYKCHQCGYTEPADDLCPRCGTRALYPRGYGTERIEKIFRYHFPSARIVRIDSDEMNYSTILHQLVEFERGQIDILIGTRVVLHGFRLSRIGLLAFLDLDGLLFQPDYNSRVHLFQQLCQGSEMVKDGEIVIQSSEIENEVIQHLFTFDTEGFYLKELKKRKDLDYPPFSDLVQTVLESEDASIGWEIISSCVSSLGDEKILGPVEHPVFKMKGKYRFHFLIKTNELKKTLLRLDEAFMRLGKKGWRVFVNPPHLY